MRQGNDLEVVTAPSDAADDEIGQNGKEKRVPNAKFGAVSPLNQSFLRGGYYHVFWKVDARVLPVVR